MTVDVTPSLILGMWAAGLAAGAALVASWRIVGVGYLWLSGGIVASIGLLAGLASGSWSAYVGAALALVGVLGGRRLPVAVVSFSLSAGFFLGATLADSSVVAALTGAVLLGAISTEMMLGHWYLVDPRLPRRPLLILDGTAGAGLAADVLVVAIAGGLTFSGVDGMFGITYVVLAAFSGVLFVGVWFSLREPRYSGVMAATGLSYLAVLTVFGVVTIGRIFLSGTL